MDPYLEIQHFVHPEHSLILIDLKDSKTRGLIEEHKKINREKQRSESAEYADDVSISCVLCGNEMLDTSYSCIDCDIHLHKVCAKLPTEMMHPIHPQHPLTLADRHVRFRCDICSKELGNGFGYYCRSCDFDVDVKCAKLPTEMMHPSHPQHPLTLTDQRSYRDFGCDFCSKSEGNGFSYHCRSCKFDVDVKCAKSPTEMMHPSHPQHPLTLTDRHRSFRCDICSKELGNGFSYYCRSCDFDVDVKRASRGEAIKHKGHPHPLYPFLKTVLSRCDACGTEHSAAAGGVSYMCNTCDFWIHEDCATLPATVKYRHHVHPLSLVVYPPSDNPFWAECSICEEKFLKQRKQWIYECVSGCRHKVHTICLAKTLIAERNKTYEVDVDIDLTKLFRLPESFQYDDLVAKIIKHMTIYYGGENTALSKVEGPLISHFSHKHPLTLIHNDMPSIKRKEDVLCNACVLPVSSPQAYYSCTECNNYAIHERCAKLPNELLQHPAHPHPLILHGPDHENYGVCPTCVFHSNGFSYRCRRPESLLCQRFAMDIKCLLPPAILHKAHKHPLKLVENCLNDAGLETKRRINSGINLERQR